MVGGLPQDLVAAMQARRQEEEDQLPAVAPIKDNIYGGPSPVQIQTPDPAQGLMEQMTAESYSPEDLKRVNFKGSVPPPIVY